MLRSLQGTVEMVEGSLVVLVLQGWGFELQVSRAARSRAIPGETLKLFTALQVSESGVALFGFLRESERALFHRLTSVKGVGGKVAMALLGTLDEGVLVRAILDGDFTVPPKKLLEPEARPADTNFTILDDSDDLPF